MIQIVNLNVIGGCVVVNLSDTVHPWKMRSALTADFCNENDWSWQ